MSCKTKEELSVEYGSNLDDDSIHSVSDIEDAFIAGYEAAQQWIEFKEGDPIPNGLKVFKFDNSEYSLSMQETNPFAIMTHYKII